MSLEFSCCELPNLDIIEGVNFSNLKSLILPMSLRNMDVKALSNKLEKRSQPLNSLDLSENNFGHSIPFFTKIIKALINCNRITHLNLRSNDLACSGLQCISNFLVASTSIKLLDLSVNFISNKGVFMLLPGIKKNKSLKTLLLSRNKFEEAGLKNLIEALIVNESISSIDFSDCNIGSKYCTYFKALLSSNFRISDLNLSENMICNSGIIEIFQALEFNPNLEMLQLNSNKITELVSISKLISSCLSIRYLNLADNCDLKSSSYFEVLLNFRNLQHLNLDSVCKVSNHNSEEFIKFLENTKISHLYLSRFTGFDHLIEGIKKNQSISYLAVTTSNIYGKMLDSLKTVIVGKQLIQYLDLSCNDIDDSSVNSIIELVRLSNLSHLNICNNNFKSEETESTLKSMLGEAISI